MTDTAKLKAAALAATPGRIGDRIDGSGSIKYRCVGADGSLVLLTDHKNNEYGFVGDNGAADELFFRLCTPESVLELIAALEAAQRANAAQDDHINQQQDRIDKLEKGHEEAAKQISSWRRLAKQNIAEREKDIAALGEVRQRIAELEAREIKPANGEVLVTVSGFTGSGKSAIAGEIEIALRAIGVPVQWANGDAEKRMTGADWLTAIEMYRPRVRIIEVNAPRKAACINLETGGE
ncbi:ead/Ea22-like family protein [Cronobacter turicensis]